MSHINNTDKGALKKECTHEEIIEKYGEVELSFSSYYKYSFTFSYKRDDVEITGSVGGDSDGIYRYELRWDTKKKVKDYRDELNWLSIKEKGEEVFRYTDY